jgi:outer membrane protein assembly factor BamD (BamD/ComL family)
MAGRGLGRSFLVLGPLSFLLLSGCVGFPTWNPFKGPDAPPGPASDLVIRDGKLEAPPTAPAKAGKTAEDMDGAKDLFRRGEYSQAEKIFHRIAEDSKNSMQIAEEARYYEAEALRLQGYYPKAADTYSRLLKDFSTGQFREQANQRLFDIANYWLDDTRDEMEAYRQKKDGKKWIVMPTSFVHFDKSKPLLDEEGWALEKLEEIKIDIRSPVADKAMFYLGNVKFYRKEYREADQHFNQLVEMLPESPLAEQALKMSILCKHLSTGGSDYDGRKTAEARQLVDRAFAAYPNLAKKDKDFLMRQLYCINQQQADKDMKIAEYYRHTGHPGSAYFYYEIVRRRYPGTAYFDKATERMHELRAQIEHSQKSTWHWPDLLPWKSKEQPQVITPPAATVAPPKGPPPGTPPVREETAPAPRTLPPELTGSR